MRIPRQRRIDFYCRKIQRITIFFCHTYYYARSWHFRKSTSGKPPNSRLYQFSRSAVDCDVVTAICRNAPICTLHATPPISQVHKTKGFSFCHLIPFFRCANCRATFANKHSNIRGSAAFPQSAENNGKAAVAPTWIFSDPDCFRMCEFFVLAFGNRL